MDSKKSNLRKIRLSRRNSITPEILSKIIKQLADPTSLEETQQFYSYALYKSGYYQRLKSHSN